MRRLINGDRPGCTCTLRRGALSGDYTPVSSTMVRLALLATAGLATAFVSKSGPAPAVVRAPAQTAMQMKLYDWKRREAAEDASVGATEFRVDNIKPAPGATKRKMRKGRGISAGPCAFFSWSRPA